MKKPTYEELLADNHKLRSVLMRALDSWWPFVHGAIMPSHRAYDLGREIRDTIQGEVPEPRPDWAKFGYKVGAFVVHSMGRSWEEVARITCVHEVGALDVEIEGKTYGWSVNTCEPAILVTVRMNTRPIPFTAVRLQQLRAARHQALGQGKHTFVWLGRDWCCAPDNDIAMTTIKYVEGEVSKWGTQ